ncbi:S41 family peptidase [candidate division KSB1 bacterium]|nr:S41 family peptidase [candidate division KSB1 bacterium]
MKCCWFCFSIICLFFISGCAGHSVMRPDMRRTNLATFEKTWQLVQKHYPYVEYKGLDWMAVYNQFLPQIQNASPDEFVALLSDMLKVLQDQHVYLKTTAGDVVTPYVSDDFKRANSLFSIQVVKKYLGAFQVSASGNIQYGRLPYNFGYIHISSFRSYKLMQEFYGLQSFIDRTDGLIIDIRNNTGGYCTNVYQLVSWFLEAPLEHPPFYVNGELQSTQPIPAYRPNPYKLPVVVLVNRVCYSSGDLFTLLMKQLPHLTVLGDTTGGGSAGANNHIPGNYELPCGTILHLSTIDFRDYDGKPWENVGIAPDITVEQSSVALQRGIDRQLESAYHYLRRMDTQVVAEKSTSDYESPVLFEMMP